MATSYSIALLSGSTKGAPIKVAADSSPGTDIHTVGSGSGVYDEVTLFAENHSASAVLLTIEINGTTDPDNLVEVTLPAAGASGDGAQLVLPSLRLNNAATIKAFAGTANAVTIFGNVNRITVT